MAVKATLAALMLLGLFVARSEATCGDVWLISSHRVCSGCPQPLECQPLRVWHLENECRWTSSDLPSLQRTDDPNVPTVVLVHGYVNGAQSAMSVAIEDMWPVYRRLCCDAGGRPFRIIVWVWPTERTLRGLRDRTIRGLRADVQRKGVRADTESILLAQVVDRIQPQVPLTLLGFSYGARVIGGALELLGGGQIRCCRLARTNTSPRVPIRAMLVAAALDADWLMPGHRNGNALSQVDRMLITVNHKDFVLKWYPHVFQFFGSPALGREGPAGLQCLSPDRAKLDLMNVTCALGLKHKWDDYVARTGMLARLGSYVFREPPAGVASDATIESAAPLAP